MGHYFFLIFIHSNYMSNWTCTKIKSFLPERSVSNDTYKLFLYVCILGMIHLYRLCCITAIFILRITEFVDFVHTP
jgi:hypothetical protein